MLGAIQILPLELYFKPNEHAGMCLASAISPMKHFRYQRNKYSNGKTDCARFVLATLLRLHGKVVNDFTMSKAPYLESDDSHVSLTLAESVLMNYADLERIHDDIVEPGDIISLGATLNRVDHLCFIGYEPNTLWQASYAGVHWTGFGRRAEYPIFRIYRDRNRDRWKVCQQDS